MAIRLNEGLSAGQIAQAETSVEIVRGYQARVGAGCTSASDFFEIGFG